MNRTALLSLTLLAACGPSATRRRADVEECSKVHEQAQLIALCLMSDHKWPEAEANAAGRAREGVRFQFAQLQCPAKRVCLGDGPGDGNLAIHCGFHRRRGSAE